MTRFLRARVEDFRAASRREPDRILLATAIVLLLVGLVMVYSASTPRAQEIHQDDFYFLRGQASRALLGVVAMWVLMHVSPGFLARHARWILLGSLVLLVLVLVPGIGVERRGVRRWLAFGFQPSELMKLSLAIYFADFLTRREERLSTFRRGLLPPLVVLGVASLLIALQPNLSAIVLLGLLAMTLLYVGGARLGHLAVLGLVVAALGAGSLAVLDYQWDRIVEFYDGVLDPAGDEYQIYQATLALGSGGVVGPGLGHSLQKYFFLPDAHTDFILAIVGEEAGFAGSIAVVLLFTVLLWRGASIAWRSSGRFNRLLALGVTSAIFYQALLNLAVVTALIPTTGQPLPFLSYGGSNLMITLAETGILLALSRHVTVPQRVPRAAEDPLLDALAIPAEEFLRP